MCVCTYIYIYMYVCMYVHINIHISYIYNYMYILICPYVHMYIYGGFPKRVYPQIIHLNRIFYYKPTIWSIPHLWNPPCRERDEGNHLPDDHVVMRIPSPSIR